MSSTSSPASPPSSPPNSPSSPPVNSASPADPVKHTVSFEPSVPEKYRLPKKDAKVSAVQQGIPSRGGAKSLWFYCLALLAVAIGEKRYCCVVCLQYDLVNAFKCSPKKNSKSKVPDLSGIHAHFERVADNPGKGKKGVGFSDEVIEAHRLFKLSLLPHTGNGKLFFSKGASGNIVLKSRAAYMPADKQENCERLLALWCAKSVRPCAIVEDEDFVKLLFELNPAFHVPKRRKIRRLICGLSGKIKEQVKRMIAAVKAARFGCPSFGGQFDGWSSDAIKSYISLSITFVPEGSDHVIYCVLACETLDGIGDGAHTIENIKAWIKKVLTDFGLDWEDFVEFVTDNAGNVKGVWAHQEENKIDFNRYGPSTLNPLYTQKGRGCTCHTLALAILDALDCRAAPAQSHLPHYHPERRKYINFMKELVASFRKSPKKTSKLDKIQSELMNGQLRPRHPNGNYESESDDSDE